jgi:hypothetical protein
MAPDASDTRAGALALRRLSPDFVAAIDRPNDHDWYSLRGTNIGEPSGESIAVSVVSVPPGCAAPRPLLVALRNPEGHWIRTYAVATTFTSIATPRLPSLYYLEVRAADDRCAGLQYRFRRSFSGGSAGGGGELIGDALLCRIAHNERLFVAARIRRFTRTRASVKSAAARRRYTGYVKVQRRALKRELREERRVCARVG